MKRLTIGIAAFSILAASSFSFAADKTFNVLGQPLATGLIQKNKEQVFFENFAKNTGLDIDANYKPIDVTGLKSEETLRVLKNGLFDIVSIRTAPTAAAPVEAAPVEESRSRSVAPQKPALDSKGVPVAWMLQVASVSSRSKAEELRDRLLAMQEKAYVKQLKVGDKEFYRVYIGPNFERAQLEKIQGSIDTRFGVKSMIVRYVP